MNDFQKLISIFDAIGCKYEIITSKEEWATQTHFEEQLEWDTQIKIDNGIGYYYFYCSFYFLNGEYKGHGCWE